VLVQMNNSNTQKLMYVNSRLPMDYCIHKKLGIPEHIAKDMHGTVRGKPINMRYSFSYTGILKGDTLNISTRLRGGNQKHQQHQHQQQLRDLRIGTWNVNSIRNKEAELYALVEQEELDIVMLQETRVGNFKPVKNLGRTCSLKATPKNNAKGGYLSGGLATIATNRIMMKQDQHNTSELILVTDLMLNN